MNASVTLKMEKNEFMTPKERWRAVLNGERPDRIPMDYWATEEFTEKFLKYLDLEDKSELFSELHIDPIVSVSPDYIGPEVPDGEDVFGCKYENVEYETGTYRECVYHPLAEHDALDEIKENFEWPKPEYWDYLSLSTQVEGKQEYPIQAGGSEPFLTYKNLRGQEKAFEDLIRRPEMVHFCLDKLYDLCYEKTKRIYEEISDRIMFSYVAEDMGAQSNLLFSPDQINEFFIPRMERMIELAHRNNIYVFHHNDGAIMEIIPDLIDLGIDVLNPIQWRCEGMDRESIKEEFGDELVLHGAMDNQYTLARGSKKEVRKEVRENINVLGRDGGYALAPCHNIQPVSSPECIRVMYEEGYCRGSL